MSSLLLLGVSLVIAPHSALAQPTGTTAASVPARLAEEGAAWAAFNALREKVKGAAPEATIKAYNEFFATNPALHPIVATVLTTDVAALYRDNLKQPAKAMEIYDWGLEKFKTHDAVILMTEGKGRTLLDTDKAKDASDLMEDAWPQIISMARGAHPHMRLMASRSVQIRVLAMQKQNKSAEATELLKSTLAQAPAWLNPQLQTSINWSDGWMYNSLVDGLIADKKVDEAARWARLGFAQSNFDKGSIERATEIIGRVWAAQEDFVSARAFGSAQDDISKPNPLSKVPLPVLSAALLESELKRLQGEQTKSYDKDRVSQIVSILIGLNRMRPAMNEARGLLVKFPTAPEGVQQVARVFKAADSSLVRANQFIAYLDGKAENPLPAFMKETDAPIVGP